jgi:hypothetical protein
MEYATGGTLEKFLRKRDGKLLTQDVSIPAVGISDAERQQRLTAVSWTEQRDYF